MGPDCCTRPLAALNPKPTGRSLAPRKQLQRSSVVLSSCCPVLRGAMPAEPRMQRNDMQCVPNPYTNPI